MKKNSALGRSTIMLVLLLLSSFFSWSQNSFKVTGKIFDESGSPVVGATVQVKGSSTATVSKVDGSFEINAPSGSATLVITSVGYTDLEVPIANNSVLNVSLITNATSMQDVVVVGYGTRKRVEVTGAVSSINAEKIASVPTTNLSQALQGRIAGIEATQSSFRPGMGARIRVRGNRSLNASNDPLVVVDGIPVAYSLDDINPTDIESVDVLKDASATAIYGVRGANGVIQVTTKKGKAGKFTLDYNGSVSFDNMLREFPVFTGPQMVDMWRQAFHADRAYAPTGAPASANQYFPNALADYKLFGGDPAMWSGVKDAYQYRVYNSPTSFITIKRAATAEEKALMSNLGLTVLDSLDVYDPTKIRNYNWGDEFQRQGMTNSHSVTVSGGSDKLRSSLGLSYFNQKGIDPGTDYKRYTVTNSNEYRPTKFLTFGNSVSYANSTQNAAGIYQAATGMIPIVTPYDANGNFLLFPNGDRQIPSPANNLGRVLNESKVSRIFGNIFAEVTLFKGLKYRTVFGLDSRNIRQGTFNGTQTSVQLEAPASATYTVTNQSSWVYDNLLYYNFDVKKDRKFNVTLLHEMQSLLKQNQLTMSAQNLIFEEQKWYSLNRNTNATVTGSGTYTAQQLLSFMGRIEYSFRNRYLVTLSNRYDNSSVLAEGKKGEYFPSASIAWQINNESFFDKQNIFNYAKLRLGIGRVGNSSINPYQTEGPLAFTNYNWGNGNAAIGLAPTTFPTPELTWEKTTTKNIGLEFGMLKNRVNMTIDLYKSTTKDMLQPATIPAANGVESVFINIGEVSNKGVEIALNTVNIASKNGFRWTTDLIFSRNKEAIEDINGTGNDNLANLWILGQPIRVYYNYQSDGIYQYADTGKGGYLKEYLWKRGTNAANTAFRPGRIRVRDLNGDTLINELDKRVLGSDNATWTGSITNTFSFKGFELSCLIYVRKGGMYRAPRPGLVGRYQSNSVNYWTPTNPSNEYQQPTRTSDVPTYWESLGYRDGSFVRVRNIGLSYRLPAGITKTLRANNITVYVNAVNPFLFHNKSEYDPETIPYAETFVATTNNTGPNSFSYRSFVCGIRLGL